MFKLLEGSEQQALLAALRTCFGEKPKLLRPEASRKESAELYVCARKFDPRRYDLDKWRELR